ncbi:hypothetical protein EDD15DRAFT_2167831 [Pisolithus albus]|nr:hypothetical protein EDD15DRAFT_2167831 [Pisolithus albus]
MEGWFADVTNVATPTDKFGNDLPQNASPNPRETCDVNDWYPFGSRLEFEMAEFLFTRSQMPQAQVDMLMRLWVASMLHHNDQAPFADHTDLHRVIDAIPLGDVPWKSIQAQYSGNIPDEGAASWMRKSYEVWFRDPNPIVENLLGNPDFNNHFDYMPYREFKPSGQRRWENMMSGNWAWNYAVHQRDMLAGDPSMHGAMLVPIILGSNKTTVSVTTGQNDYYPLYLSIGNVHNNVRRAHQNSLVLLAFLAIPKTDRENEDSTEFHKFRCQLFHTTISHILSSLRHGMLMPEVRQCPDGHFRRVRYALAAYIADYPEQILLSCLVQGWCPLCTAMSSDLEGGQGIPRSHMHAEFCIRAFALAELWDQYGMVGDLTPFTNDFPRADIYKMLTPNLLHQIIKGIFKDHLVSWIGEYLKITYGEAEANRILDDIDRRIAAVPPYPNLQRFPEGRRFKQWTGDDSKALMKVFLPACYVPPAMICALSAFLDFCYCARRNSLNESALECLQSALDRFHLNRRIFQETGICDSGPKGFSLPRQHAMNHYCHLIQEFGALNGICSSITESKHIKAVKKPWRRSNHYQALGQMLLPTTNQRLDKLAAARVDFEARGMLNTSNSDRNDNSRYHISHNPSNNDDDDGSDAGDDEIQMPDEPHVLNYVHLARTPARNYPSTLQALADHIDQPDLPLLVSRFLQFQFQDDADPNTIPSYPNISESLVSVFHSAVATFYAPSDLSGLGGMHSECIRSTPCWRKGPARYDTIFLEKDQDVPGMKGLHVGRVFIFFSFIYNNIRYPCALIQWFTTVSDEAHEDTGMWIVEPDFDANGQRQLEVIHIHSILRGAHLIPVYSQDRLPADVHCTNSLDIFRMYYVNKYIDHHAFEIVF